MSSKTPWRFARILLGTLMLLGMPLANGMPTMFADTRAYMTLGEAAVSKIVGKQTSGEPVAAAPADAALSPSDAREKARRALASAGARSPYFSVYLYVLATLGGMWFVAFVQALLTAATVETFYRALGLVRSAPYLLTMAILAALSTAPIFVGFMMPDIYTALGAIAATALVIRNRLARLDVAFLVVIAGFSVLAHSTHVLIILAAAAGAALVHGLTRAERPRTLVLRMGAIVLLALLGPVGTIVYGMAARAAQGEDIYRPPFLTARLLEDGPGRAYLAHACAADDNAFALCHYRDRSLTDSQIFLWDRTTPEGVFATADADERIKLSRDEMRFVLGAVAFDPAGALKAALVNIGLLAASYQVDDVTDTSAVYADPEFRTLATYVRGTQACVENPNLCAPRLPIVWLGVLTGVAALVSILIAAASLAYGPPRARAAIVGLWFAWGANVVICGALSGPFARYETRMSWALVLAACVGVSMLAEQRSGRKIIAQQLA